MACLEKIKGKNKILRVDWSELVVIFTLLVVGMTAFILKSDFGRMIDSRLVSAYCDGCSTASCGACSSTVDGWRCSCTGYVDGFGYTSCGGVSASSCVVPPVIDNSTCTTSCSGGKTHSGDCPSGYNQANCSAVSQPNTCSWTFTCCDCVPIPTYTCSRASMDYHCMWATWQNYNSNCSVWDPAGAVDYTLDCDSNFDATDANCASCYCTNCSGGVAGSDASCYAIRNYPPTLDGLSVENYLGNTVSPETGTRNQICQSIFGGNRYVIFQVSVSDSDGIGDISNVTLTWNGRTIPRISAIGSITTFAYTFDSTWNSTTIYPLIATVVDYKGASSTYSARSFKIWDCRVPVGGTVYDSTDDGGPVCPTTGFTKVADPAFLNFQTLSFVRNGVGISMTVNAANSTYTNGSNYLTWGVDGYIPSFNTDIALSDKQMESKDSVASTWNCGWSLNTSYTDPYSTSPTLVANFSGVLIQDPWWQTSQGGAISNSSVDGQVPITCSTVNCKISPNALVAAPSVTNTSGKSLSSAQDWYYSGASAKLADVNSNYNYFYNQYYVKNGSGTVLTGNQTMSAIGSSASGIYFINGNLAIDTNQITNAFLMVIVSGNIDVSPSVTQVNGIYLANNISATGSGDGQLVFYGSLFASGTVNFSRDYVNRINNNTTPAVVVSYNPKLLFNLPGSLAKVLTNWQWGN